MTSPDIGSELLLICQLETNLAVIVRTHLAIKAEPWRIFRNRRLLKQCRRLLEDNRRMLFSGKPIGDL